MVSVDRGGARQCSDRPDSFDGRIAPRRARQPSILLTVTQPRFPQAWSYSNCWCQSPPKDPQRGSFAVLRRLVRRALSRCDWCVPDLTRHGAVARLVPPKSAKQRLRSLSNRPRIHAHRRQAVVRPGGGGWREGRLYEVQRAQARRTALSAAPLTASLRHQLPCSTLRRLQIFRTLSSKAAGYIFSTIAEGLWSLTVGFLRPSTFSGPQRVAQISLKQVPRCTCGLLRRPRSSDIRYLLGGPAAQTLDPKLSVDRPSISARVPGPVLVDGGAAPGCEWAPLGVKAAQTRCWPLASARPQHVLGALSTN